MISVISLIVRENPLILITQIVVMKNRVKLILNYLLQILKHLYNLNLNLNPKSYPKGYGMDHRAIHSRFYHYGLYTIGDPAYPVPYLCLLFHPEPYGDQVG